jgi:putative glutamine amidotransferase
MTARPRIAIPVPTAKQPEYNDRAWPQYAAAVEHFGAEAVAIPLDLSPEKLANLITSCQGVLLPGSPADVNPARYGQERLPETAEPDPAREDVEELLLQDAYNLHKPLLALCYGLQSLNTWRTGTLVQDLSSDPVNHRNRKAPLAHSVAIDPASRLAEIVRDSPEVTRSGDFLHLPVNSSHHQAVGIAGDGLRIVARCPEDGVIEAVEGFPPSHFVLGIQWHPERGFDSSPASQKIFERFVAVIADWQPRIVTDSVA